MCKTQKFLVDSLISSPDVYRKGRAPVLSVPRREPVCSIPSKCLRGWPGHKNIQDSGFRQVHTKSTSKYFIHPWVGSILTWAPRMGLLRSGVARHTAMLVNLSLGEGLSHFQHLKSEPARQRGNACVFWARVSIYLDKLRLLYGKLNETLPD